jgi:hypothetical protein
MPASNDPIDIRRHLSEISAQLAVTSVKVLEIGDATKGMAERLRDVEKNVAVMADRDNRVLQVKSWVVPAVISAAAVYVIDVIRTLSKT